MKCFGIGIRSASGINYFGIGLQSREWTKGVVEDIILGILELKR